MIHLLIEHIVAALNEHMTLRSGQGEQRVVAASLFNSDGQPNPLAKEKVVVAVVHIEEDRVFHSVETFSRKPDGGSEVIKPEISLNLYLLFAGNFAEYQEALKAVSYVIGFFQHRHSFDYLAIPGLRQRKGRIACELFSPTFEQQNHIWGALGAKYLPSVIYKVGMVGISDKAVEGEAPPVEQVLINEPAP